MQEILGLVRRCVEDYDMIQAGDTVAVGVSGGKDSLLTLTALARLSRFYPKPFRVVAITVEADRPVMVAAMIMGTDGGMMGPRQEEAAVIATEKGTS